MRVEIIPKGLPRDGGRLTVVNPSGRRRRGRGREGKGFRVVGTYTCAVLSETLEADFFGDGGGLGSVRG
jgi:hypothetical protein